jgi:hypothetical protein
MGGWEGGATGFMERMGLSAGSLRGGFVALRIAITWYCVNLVRKAVDNFRLAGKRSLWALLHAE